MEARRCRRAAVVFAPLLNSTSFLRCRLVTIHDGHQEEEQVAFAHPRQQDALERRRVHADPAGENGARVARPVSRARTSCPRRFCMDRTTPTTSTCARVPTPTPPRSPSPLKRPTPPPALPPSHTHIANSSGATPPAARRLRPVAPIGKFIPTPLLACFLVQLGGLTHSHPPPAAAASVRHRGLLQQGQPRAAGDDADERVGVERDGAARGGPVQL